MVFSRVLFYFGCDSLENACVILLDKTGVSTVFKKKKKNSRELFILFECQ